MSELISWLQTYPAPVVVLLVLVTSCIFLIKYFVQKWIDSNFEANKERLTLITKLSLGLEEAMGNLYSWRENRNSPAPKGFFRHAGALPLGDEIIPLSRIWDELQANKPLLGEPFSTLFEKQVQLAGAANNVPFDDKIQWAEKWKEWDKRRKKIHQATRGPFSMFHRVFLSIFG